MSTEATKVNEASAGYSATADAQYLPPGYKRTAAGVIPHDWELYPVGRMGEVITGKALAVNGPGQQRPYLRTKNVFDGRIDIDDVLTMPMTDAQFAHFMLLRDDVLLNEGQSLDLVGRCAIYQGEYPTACAIQNQLLRFRARAGVSALFASHLFRHCQETGVFTRIALQTTSIAHLGGSRFERTQLPWPKSEAEQRAIAEVLSDVDGLLGALEALIAKKRAIKQAARQQLLTGKTRLPGFIGSVGFQGTEVGLVPADWSVRPLTSEVEGLESGVSVRSVDANNGATQGPFILKTSAVTRGRFLPHECKPVDPRDTFRAQLSPRADTILISRMNTIGLVGESGYVDRDYSDLFIPDRLWMTRFRAHSRTSAHWLSYVLSARNYRSRLRAIATGTSGSMKNIAKSSFLALPLAFPSPEEQTAIATVLSDMDAEIASLERRRDKTRAIKQGMMQQLLTGKTRLAVAAN